MSIFSPENTNLARKFMQGSQNERFPNMAGFSKTPQGQEILRRVMTNMQARRGSRQAQPRRTRPAALEDNR